MKVLNILLSNQIGGPPLRVLETSKRLRDAGVNVTIVAPDEGGNFAELARNNGFKTCQVHLLTPKFFNSFKSVLDNIKWLISIPVSVLKIFRVIKEEDVDIVHLHGLLNISGAVAAKLSGRKLVWHLVGSVYPNWMIHILMPFVIKTSDHMIFIAQRLSEYYLGEKREKLKHKYSIIYNGVDTEKFNVNNVDKMNVEQLKKELEITDNPIIGCIGNINSAKGYEYLIYAAEMLNKDKITAKFIIVGTELATQKNYFASLKKLISDLEMEKKVIFSGPRDDVVDLLSVFDIFALPSIAEGTPMAVLEAMAMEKPVVATNVGAVSEQIEDNVSGLVVEPQDPGHMSKAVLSLIKDGDMAAELGKKARKRVLEQFSLSQHVEGHLKIYNSLNSNKFTIGPAIK